ncbi:MAG: LuxR family transcriptional regulator, partial [Ilumatobacteraceae bacterium]
MLPDPSLPDAIRPPVAGRDDVLDDLLELVRGAAAGHGAACTVVGEAGIGKTTLLDAVTAGAIAEGVRVIRLRGVEAEVELAWSGLAGLLEGMLDRLDRLTPGRAAAIRSALALEGGAAEVEPFAIAVASRDLLVDAADAAPIVVVIDDLPWIDLSTRRVLAYVAQRLDVERVAMISSRRPDADAAATDTGPTIELGAWPDADAEALLVDAGVSSPSARAALIAAAGGIPMVLLEAAHLLSADERAGRAELPDPLPVGRSGRQAAELVLDRVTPTVRTALVIAAAEPDGDLDRIIRALAEQHLGAAELEAAEAGGVISIEAGRLAFRHPLMRSAAYYGASRAAQRAAHRAISHTLPEGSPVRAWHLARAALGPDEEVAAALDGAAMATVHRGALASAARSWELASRLSPEPAGRAKRLRLAAGATLDAGNAGEAGLLLDRADAVILEHPQADDLIERIHREQLRCRLPLSKGGVSRPADGLRSMAADVETTDPGLAVDLRFTALDEYIREGAFADMAATIAEVDALRAVVDHDRARRIDVARGALLVVRGDAAGEPLLDRYREMVGPDRSDADTHFLAEILGPALAFLRRTTESDALLTVLEADLRARGAVRLLVDVLGAQAMAQYSRSFPAALAAALEAVSLAEGDGTPELASLAACVLALCSAVIGDEARCEQAAALLRDVSAPERRVLGPVGLAYLALNQGRLDDADAIYRQIVTVSPIGRGLIRWETEWIETLERAGRRDEATEVFRQLVTETSPDVLAYQEHERVAGLLADDDAVAYGHYARSVAAAVAVGNPFAEGRTQLVWGEQLRRARHRAEARTHLARATELFRTVGATVFADRAATEFRASGGSITDDVASHRLLTPHELQVARLVVGGASNRDLATKLFISPRTVESHLTSIFRKLSVRNRQELA